MKDIIGLRIEEEYIGIVAYSFTASIENRIMLHDFEQVQHQNITINVLLRFVFQQPLHEAQCFSVGLHSLQF